MWRQTTVGIVTGLVAVLAAMLTRPADRHVEPAVTMVAVADRVSGGAFYPSSGMRSGWIYPPPTTRPAALAALDAVVSELDVNNLGLEELFDYLKKVTGTNILVDWEVLGQRNVFRDSAVTLELRNVTARQLLDRALRQFGVGEDSLAYFVEGNVLTVTTREEARNFVLVRVYHVRDLVERAVEEAIRQGRLDPSGPSPLPAGGGSGSSGFGLSRPAPKPATRGDLEDEFTVELTNLIRETVDIDSWIENGGRFGQMRYFLGRLVITQASQAHAEIEALLQTLREKP